ncbi:signal peptidase I [Candidatus Bathyarchaeota archaeon]|nr:signal peptidase I [Candidatus Bathyarchaeota archaeon]
MIYLATFASLQSLRFVLSTDYPILVVEGPSMEKTYFQGDLLLLKGIPTQDIKVGDVVVYQRTAGSLRIVHRVVDIKVVNEVVYFIVQGDNRVTNQYPDSPVPSTAILCTVIYHVPALGNVVLALQSPVGLVLSGGLIIIILLLEVFNEEEKKPKTSDAL